MVSIFIPGMHTYFGRWTAKHVQLCEYLFEDKQNIYNAISNHQFDLIIYDIHEHCAALFKVCI